jgi:hypothetical protein
VTQVAAVVRLQVAAWRSVRGRAFVARELALWALVYPLYLLTREGAEGSRALALRHAREIVALERRLGLAIERGVQGVVDAVPLARGGFELYYEWAFYPLLAAAVVWLALARRGHYRRTRRAMVAALAAAAVFFVLFPTAPPRLLPGSGIVDTVGMHDHDVGSFHGISYNPYAAMPSMHVGWSLIVAAGVFRAVRARLVRAAAVVHPLLMSAATVATGNHYVLDCAAGAAIGAVALVAAGAADRARERPRGRLAVPAAAGLAGRNG